MIHILLDQSYNGKKFSAFAAKQKWMLLAVFDADPDNGQAAQIVCEDPATKTRCYYVEDFLIDLRYLIVDGKQQAAIADAIYASKQIKVIAPEVIYSMVKKARSRQALVLGLRMLAVISPETYDEPTFELFQKGLEHKDPRVRHASLQIVTYPNWKQFFELAKLMHKEDPDPGVREKAKGFITAYKSILETKKKKVAAKKKKLPAKKAVSKK